MGDANGGFSHENYRYFRRACSTLDASVRLQIRFAYNPVGRSEGLTLPSLL